MAKQLYDYWFVQFDFPNEEGKPYKSSGGKMVWNDKLKREIPVGWIAVNYTNLFNIGNGQTIPQSYGNIPAYGGNGIVKTIEASNYSACIIIGRVGANCGSIHYSKVPCWVSDNAISVCPKNESWLPYLFYSLKLYNLSKSKGGSSQPLITHDILKKLYFPMDINYINKFCNIINKTQNLIYKNLQEILNLTRQRDELLPLLMNGQVSVNYHLSNSYMRQFVYSYYHSLKNAMKQKFIKSVLDELCKVLDSQQVRYVGNILEQSLLNLDVIERVSNDERISQENDALLLAFLSAKKIEGCSAKTIKYYQATIEHLFDEIGKPISDITTNDIRSYLAQYQESKQSSKVTIDNMRRIFSSFFAWLEDEDYILKSPVRRIHKVRTDSLVKEVINDECMELLRDSCTEIRDLAMIDLLASTGMRVGELVQMNIEDIDFQERQCKVFGKGNKEREVYFNARAKIHLQQYVAQRRDDNPALFVSLSSPHKRLSISGVEVRLRTLGKRLNLTKIHPHKFRRTLATMAIDKGMPIEQVQRLLGHVKIDTTLHYAMVNQNNVKISHRRYIG